MNDYWGAVTLICERIANDMRDDIGRVQLCLVGGAAMYHHTHSRMSEDVEGFFNRRGIPLSSDLIEPFMGDDGKERMLYYDTGYTKVFGLMHPDVADDGGSDFLISIGPMDITVLKPVDLAISKVSRYINKDANDITTLISLGLIDGDVFKKRAYQALDYYVGRRECVKIIIDNVYDEILAWDSRCDIKTPW